ncbi:hypothetical protein BDV25DRAFT_72359 [Aspergillus avenaceus]|uniref:Uncharacterized protein n=1 Tax=Aspergillus avenaceus TaxID=36643 RepID=A0A5N6TGD9_ASPAV|nr:hypothetical protein BDV25DRAFT_72359 [Aspergillus avenaceus]
MRDDTEGTRPRRLSFTQHLQRMLHIEGSGTQKQSVGSHVPSGGNDSSVILHSDQSSGSKGKGKTSRPGVNDKSNDHTKTHNAYSYTTLGSRVSASDVENSENSPRHRSIQTTSQQLQAKPTPKDQPKRSDVCVSPTWNSNPTQKNERHATLRVEAKRAGHEKKFMKVEQSELTKNSIFIKREPRRLTKKQPFGSTSRASSVSLDTPDASRRFSSIFPGSRRTSRSRSQPSSVNGDDNDKSQLPPQSLRAGEVSNPVSTSQPTTPVLSTTLPESFCATISKELAVQSNPLLPIDIASSQPQKILQSVEMATAVEATEKQNHFSSSKKSRLHGQGFRQRSPVILGDSARTSAPDEPAELDRITFAASLDLGKRVFNSRQHSQRASLQQEFARDASRVPETNTTSKTPTASGNSAKIKTSNLPSSPSAQQLDSPEDTQIRYPLSDVNRRHRMGKSFTSSPLASLRTLKNSAGTQSDITSAERTSDLADNLNHGGPFVLCQTASHLNMIPSHSIASSRPQDSCYQNSRQLPIKTLDISMDTHQQSGLANDSKLPECRCKSHLGVATSGTQPKRLSTLTQRSNQKEQRVAGRARPRYREMPFVSPKGDSRSIQHRQTNLYTGPAPQKMIDRKVVEKNHQLYHYRQVCRMNQNPMNITLPMKLHQVVRVHRMMKAAT